MSETVEKQILNSIGQDTHIEPTGLKGKELLRWAINRLIANDGKQWHQQVYHNAKGHCLWGWVDIGIHGSAALKAANADQMYSMTGRHDTRQVANDIGMTVEQLYWTAACDNTKERLYLFCREFLADRPTILSECRVAPEFAEVLHQGVTEFVPL